MDDPEIWRGDAAGSGAGVSAGAEVGAEYEDEDVLDLEGMDAVPASTPVAAGEWSSAGRCENVRKGRYSHATCHASARTMARRKIDNLLVPFYVFRRSSS
jgi:hypothetical protein